MANKSRISNKEVKQFKKFANIYVALQAKVHKSFKNINGQCEG